MANIMKFGVGVGVLVVRDGSVLMGLRSGDKVKASSDLNGEDTWTMPGGKIDVGETLLHAALRELAEETGIRGSKLKAFCVQDDITETAHYTTVGFCTTAPAGVEPKVMEPDEITEWRWHDINKLPANLYIPSKKFIAKYLSGEFYT